MKKLFTLTCMITALLLGSGLKSGAQKKNVSSHRSLSSLKSRFVNVPDTVQTSIYWYWISGNISKEGVVKDLEAMKKVGINRAFIGNIGLDNVPPGGVKMFSNEWWDILHTALKTATRLNIQIGIFNGPGWSQSGGPWVKPSQSMRYLTSSEIKVKGPQTLHQKLNKPQSDFQDVKVLAYPVAADYGSNIPVTFSSTSKVDSLDNLTDNNLSTGIHFRTGQKFSLDMRTKGDAIVRSITLSTLHQPVYLEGDVQAETQTGATTLRHFVIDRRNPALNTGFIPWGPASITIPASSTGHYKLIFTNVSGDSGIADIKVSATPAVEQYLEKSLAKMWPTPHPFWDAYQWAPQPTDTSDQIIDPAKVVDVTKYMTPDGVLNWQVPAGNWIIERTGMVPTKVANSPAPPEGTGLEVDKMSRAHVAAHFNAFLGEIIKRIPAEDRKTWKVAVEDSYETGSQNWTDNLISEFKAKYKYDPTPYMPVLQGKVVGSEDKSDRFLWDLRRLIADDVSFKYVGGLRDISHKHGLTTWLENYGHWGYPGEFLQYGGQSDEVGGEFWSEGDLGDIENRAASSSAHIYGKTKVSAESFTAAGSPFYRYPAMFKKRGDRFFTEGINNTLLHVYVSQPKDTSPGLNAWFGVEFNRHNTWFYDMDIFLKYIKRCNMMLQQGRYVADVAYFIGEDAPKMTGVTDPALPQGYSFDYINADVIMQRLTVKDGKLTLPNGLSYSILVLPKLATMRPELLIKLKELVQQGAVILGPKPERSPSLANYPVADMQVKQLAAQLWGKADSKGKMANRYGKGMVISGMNLEQALNLLKIVPDLKIAKSDSVLFIHRKLADASVYFLSNQKNTSVSITGAFRITNQRAGLWNAVTGAVRNLPVYHQTNNVTTVPIQLAPYESAFVVFENKPADAKRSSANYPLPIKEIELTKPWIVNFDKMMRGPANPVVFDKLTDWSVNSSDSIKYYSGTAYYNTKFDINSLQKGARYFVDLGLARAIAKVFLNGIEVGGAWTPPYEVDITRALKTGENSLQIKVVNTWYNRLIGDLKSPDERGRATVAFSPDANAHLASSGLLGPVKIVVKKFQ